MRPNWVGVGQCKLHVKSHWNMLCGMLSATCLLQFQLTFAYCVEKNSKQHTTQNFAKMNAASCQFLEQLYFRSCALRCEASSSTSGGDKSAEKRLCVEGCRLAKGKPLNSAVLAYSLFGIEEETVHEYVLTEIEMQTISGRMQSITNGINQACKRECNEYCATSTTEPSACKTWCAQGCFNFIKPLVN